jgi:flagellar biosynthesis/type III secretory pathway chaperone
MHSPESIVLFERLIAQEIDCAQRLSDALAAERSALAAAISQPQSLQQATQLKSDLLVEMERRVAAHEGFLTSRRLLPGKQGTERFLASLPKEAALHSLWQRLQQLATACRDDNEINGNIILLSQARLRRALETLRGPTDSAKTYGRGGQTRPARHSQLIVKV